MISFDNLEKSGVVHGISEVEEGSFNFYTSPKAVLNLLKITEKAGAKRNYEDVILAEQVHGRRIHKTTPRLGGYVKLGADGLISETPGQVLAVKTADCLPLLFYNPLKKRVAAVHAGRKGLEKLIVQEAVIKMENPEVLRVGVGPHIKKCCYSFDSTLKSNFQKSYWSDYYEKRGDHIFLDLTRSALDQLKKEGVKRENIEISEFCTFCAAHRFFSYRKRKEKTKFYQKWGRFPETGSFITLTKSI